MHEKVNHLFTQKTQRQADIRQNKCPLALSRLLLQIFFNVIFCFQIFRSHMSTTLSVTFNFLFIFFDRKFYYFLGYFLAHKKKIVFSFYSTSNQQSSLVIKIFLFYSFISSHPKMWGELFLGKV